MDTNYAYFTLGFIYQGLADIFAEGIDANTFISALIIQNRLIYHNLRALLRMRNLKLDFSELKKQISVVYRIIKVF